MPNRYSHAFVLARYESKGFIALPHPSPSPQHVSLSSHNYRLSIGSSEVAATPPLNAVPGLSSDSSTTSTASSLDEIPPRPLYSASSSIVTEIYAPQSPSPIPDVISRGPEEHPAEKEPSPPSSPSYQSSAEQPPSRPTSRFSSLHNFSAFLDPPPPPQRHKSLSHKHHDRNPPPLQILHPISSDPASEASRSHTVAQGPPTSNSKAKATQQSHPPSPPRPRAQPRHMPYKRLHPIFSTESLASLSLAELEALEPHLLPSPNAEVLPWEYPVSPPSKLEVYEPRGFSIVATRAKGRGHEVDRLGKDVRSSTTTMDAYISTKEPIKSQAKSLQPNIPTRRSSISRNPSHSTPSDDPLFTPIFSNDTPLDLIPTPDQHPLSHSSSFDSVAPPPIRKGPRQSTTLPDGRGRKWLGGEGRS